MILTTALQIFATILLPIFLLIGCGLAADRCFRLDLPTLSRLCFHLFLPALIFVKVLESDIDLAQMRTVVVATLAHLAAILPLALWLFGRLPFGDRRQVDGHRLVLGLGAAFFNCGNFGIPLAELAFPGLGAGIMAVILMTQNFVTFSLGIYLVERHRGNAGRGFGRQLAGFARMPILHAIWAAFLLRLLDIGLVPQLRQPLHYLGDGLIPVALLTLGVQLGRSRLGRHLPSLLAVAVARLAVSPLVAWGLVLLLGLSPPLSSIFVVAAGLPVAVNVYIIAAEYDLDSDLASQTIFWTTLLSALTLSALLAVFSP